MRTGAHRTVIEAGPGTVRRLCCGTNMIADSEMSRICTAALDAIDDQMALVDGRPVSVATLWQEVLRSLGCGSPDTPRSMVIVHPTWWPTSRIRVLTAAAKSVAGNPRDENDPNDPVVQPRSWLLTHGSNAVPESTVIVEIAQRLVSVTGAIEGQEVVAVPRRMDPQPVGEQVLDVIARITRGMASVVLIDAPSTVVGGAAVATLIAAAIREVNSGHGTVVLGDAQLTRLAQLAGVPVEYRTPSAAKASGVRLRVWKHSGLAAAGVVLAVAVPAVAAESRHGPPVTEKAPTTFLVEGRVALTVPANWPTQRVVAGPGSARVQVMSPSDPEVALHVTQSSVPDEPRESLGDTAERLKRAIDAEPAGVFVDFNPSGASAGRPAVTYREVRAGHHVLWTVLLDGAVRISIGCQSRPGGEDAIRDVCEQAVRSAHAFG